MNIGEIELIVRPHSHLLVLPIAILEVHSGVLVVDMKVAYISLLLAKPWTDPSLLTTAGCFQLSCAHQR